MREYYLPNQYRYYLRAGWLKKTDTHGIAGAEIRILRKLGERALTPAEFWLAQNSASV